MASKKPGAPERGSKVSAPMHDRETLLDRHIELKVSQSELAEANARIHATLDAAVDGIIS
ncbi:MAG: hypothetical protein ACI8W3_002648, partial [Myxococcota bacterium]